METDLFDFTTAPWLTNDTEEEPCDLSPRRPELVSQTGVHSIICAFGLVGNVLVIVTYCFYKRTKTMTDVYLFNVAVADLIFVVALPLIVYNELTGWSMGAAACRALRSAYSVNLYSGILLLACVSGDRYVAIVQARRSFGSRANAVTYSRLICAAVWAFALVLTLPTVIYSELLQEEDPMGQSAAATCQLSFDSTGTAKLMKVLVPGLQMAVGFLLPLLVMLFCYSCIVRTLLRATSRQRHKAVRVVLAVVVVFILCHLPYNLALLLHTMSLFRERSCVGEKTKLLVLSTSRSVAYLHCCLNPILYAFIGVKFRSHFQQILSDFWCFSKKYLRSARTARGTSDVCNSGLRISEGSNNMSSFSV